MIIAKFIIETKFSCNDVPNIQPDYDIVGCFMLSPENHE